MNKRKIIEELTNLLTLSLRHKIGSMVNDKEIYAQKYADEAQTLLNNAKMNILGITFNIYEMIKIKDLLKKKLRAQLESKTFLNEKKFDLMDPEIEGVLKELGLKI